MDNDDLGVWRYVTDETSRCFTGQLCWRDGLIARGLGVGGLGGLVLTGLILGVVGEEDLRRQLERAEQELMGVLRWRSRQRRREVLEVVLDRVAGQLQKRINLRRREGSEIPGRNRLSQVGQNVRDGVLGVVT